MYSICQSIQCDMVYASFGQRESVRYFYVWTVRVCDVNRYEFRHLMVIIYVDERVGNWTIYHHIAIEKQTIADVSTVKWLMLVRWFRSLQTQFISLFFAVGEPWMLTIQYSYSIIFALHHPH